MVFQCRTVELREKLIAQYDIQPITHVRLLNGQERRSCTNDLLIGSYYCFSYKEKGKGDISTFLCGSYAARHFLSILNHPTLPMFDPTKGEVFDSSSISITTSGTSTKKQAVWNPAAKQLHNAINLLVICWGTSPGKALLDIKTKLEVSKTKEPFNGDVKSINTIISRDKRKRTLQQMIDELRRNNNIRNYNFDLLNAILASRGINETHFG